MERLVEILEILKHAERVTFSEICDELKKLEPKKYSLKFFIRVFSKVVDNFTGGFEHWVKLNLDALCKGGLAKRWQGIGEENDQYAISSLGLARLKRVKEYGIG